MARAVNRLNARTVVGPLPPGRHADGAGLYLQVDLNGARRWVFLFRRDGKTREMGLGGLRTVPLARARELAADARQTVAAGADPILARRTVQGTPTFGEFASEVITSLEANWRNVKHRAQWRATLSTYASPIWTRRVDQIDTTDVLSVLQPIWGRKPETASRTRARIEKVLDAAKAKGLRSGENPARWRGHLENLLPKAPQLSRGHHAAMPYARVPSLMAELRARASVSAHALQFTILTASRTSEVVEARWEEIDLDQAIWVVPAARTKAARDHRVPLVRRALHILHELHRGRTGDFVFSSTKCASPISKMAMLMLLRDLAPGFTVHGFRSAFRDWVGEETEFPRELAEAALAHVVGDKTERAYRRGDALTRRRALMEAWSDYCSGDDLEPEYAL